MYQLMTDEQLSMLDVENLKQGIVDLDEIIEENDKWIEYCKQNKIKPTLVTMLEDQNKKAKKTKKDILLLIEEIKALSYEKFIWR